MAKHTVEYGSNAIMIKTRIHLAKYTFEVFMIIKSELHYSFLPLHFAGPTL